MGLVNETAAWVVVRVGILPSGEFIADLRAVGTFIALRPSKNFLIPVAAVFTEPGAFFRRAGEIRGQMPLHTAAMKFSELPFPSELHPAFERALRAAGDKAELVLSAWAGAVAEVAA